MPPPSYPKIYTKTVPAVVQTKAIPDSNKNISFSIDKAKDTIAILSLKEPPGSGAGALAADQFVMAFQKKGYHVIDREQIERVLREKGIIAKGKTTLSDLDIAKKLRSLFAAKYFIFGAITEYNAQNQNIFLPKYVKQDDMEKYEQEYEIYSKNSLVQLQQLSNNSSLWVKSPDEFREYVENMHSKQMFARIANVGITVKMIDTDSTDIVYVGQCNVSDEKLQNGMKRIVSAIIDELIN